MLLLVALLEVTINRVAVPMLRPLKGAPPWWHEGLDYVGLFLFYFAGVLGARFRLKRKVQALSSEAKASAMIIGSLPFIIGTGLYFINGPYMSVLFNTTKGQSWLIGCAVWMLLGCLVMRAMINFKI